MIGTILLILQVLAATIFVILMAVQTDKAQQSGVMGLGGQGGRNMGDIEMPVGAERILKPMSKWTAVAFLILSTLSAMHAEDKLQWWYLPFALVAYLAIMLYGDRVWGGVQRLFGPQN
jgi:preprotein translocase subunit SecG